MDLLELSTQLDRFLITQLEHLLPTLELLHAIDASKEDGNGVMMEARYMQLRVNPHREQLSVVIHHLLQFQTVLLDILLLELKLQQVALPNSCQLILLSLLNAQTQLINVVPHKSIFSIQ